MPRKEYLSCPLPPKAGDEVYVDDFACGEDWSQRGGKTTVIDVYDTKVGGATIKMVRTEVNAQGFSNWEFLGPKQKGLSRKFGKQQALMHHR